MDLLYVTVTTTEGLSIGMKVEEYTVVNANNTTVDASSLITTNIPSNTYIKNIVNATTIELGGVVANARSYFSTGVSQNATGTTSAGKLLFKLEDTNGDRKGIWSGLEGTVDASITQDTVYPECSGTANAISTFFSNIKTIINNGISPVADRYADAHDLLLANKNWIADVAVKDMQIQYPTFQVPGGAVNCFDDVVDVVEAIAYNIKYGSNNKVYDAANFYVVGAHVAGEEEQSVYVFDIAKAMAEKGNSKHYLHSSSWCNYNLLSDQGSNLLPILILLVVILLTHLCRLANGVQSNSGNLPAPVTAAGYDPASGQLVITSAGHGLTTANTLTIANNALTFTCAMDNHATQHSYPRRVICIWSSSCYYCSYYDTITVNVGPAGSTTFYCADVISAQNVL